MSLAPQKTVVPLGGGLDRKGQKDLVEGHFEIVNFRFTETGALKKRGAYLAHSEVGLAAGALINRLATYEDMPIIVGDGVQRYSDDAGQWFDASVKGPRAIDVSSRPVLRSDEGANYCDTAAAGNYVCHVWTYVIDSTSRPTLGGEDHPDAGEVFIRVEEADSGVVVLGPQKITNMNVGAFADTGGSLSVVAIHESQFVVFARRASDSELVYAIVSTASGVSLAAVQILSVGVVAVNSRLHYNSQQDEDEIYFVQERIGSASTVYRAVPNANPATSLSIESQNNFTSGMRPREIYHDDVSGQVRVAGFADSNYPPDLPVTPNSVWVLSFAEGTIPVVAGSELLLHAPALGDARTFVWANTSHNISNFGIVPYNDVGDFLVVWDGNLNTTTSFLGFALHSHRVLTSGTPTGDADVAYRCSLHARPFRPAGQLPVILATYEEEGFLSVAVPGFTSQSIQQPGCIMLEAAQSDGDGFRYVGNYQVDVATRNLRLSHCYELGGRGSDAFVCGSVTYEIEPATEAQFATTRVYSVRMNVFRPADKAVDVTVANDRMVVQAGSVAGYGGLYHVEHAMPPPRITNHREYSTATPWFDTTTYSHPSATSWIIVACWRWRDERGNLHRSAPSTPYTADTSFFTAVRAKLPAPRNWGSLTESDLYLELYCDPPVDSGELAPVGEFSRYWTVRLDDVIDAAAPWQTEFLPDPLSGLGSPIDLDDQLVPLYTNGGELRAELAPPMSAVSASRRRIFGADAEMRNRIWYTLPLQTDVAPRWNANFTALIPDDAGQITALAALDDFLVVFTASSTFLLEGSGEDRLGAGQPFRVRRISREIGCTNKQSVALVDAGVLFESARGIYLLEQGRQFSYIGAPVEQLTRGDIVAASVISENHEVLFSCDDGTVLLLDLISKSWSTFELASAAITATAWNGQHLVADAAAPAPNLVLESLASSQSVSASVTTGWLKLTGLGGFKRIWQMLLMGRASNLDTDAPGGRIRISCGYDHEEDFSPVDVYDFEVDELESFDPLRLLTPYFRRGRCQAIRFRIEYVPALVVIDAETTLRSDVQLTLASMTLSWGAHPGISRRKPALPAGGT